MTVDLDESVSVDRTSSNGHDNEDQQERRLLAEKETKSVFRLRVAVIFALFVAASVVSAVVYVITTRAEESEFEAQFEGAADKLLSSFEDIIRQKLGAVGSLALSLTAYAKAQNLTWPFVTMDHAFEQRAAGARTLSNALHMSLLPIVYQEDREAWETYSVKHPQWYQEGFAKQKELEESGFQSAVNNAGSRRNLQDQNINFNVGFASRIFQFTEYYDIIADPTNGPYVPVWQSAPVTSLDAVNLNLISFPADKTGLERVMETGSVAFSGLNIAPPGNTSSSDLLTAWYASLLSTFAGEPVEYTGDPLCTLYFPIFDEYDEDKERNLVAFMNLNLVWASYFTNILPSNTIGVIVVLDNECHGSFTYEINGAEASTIGLGDLHDPKYDHLERKASFNDLESVADGSEQGLKIDKVCPYFVRIYPSQKMNDEHTTKLPLAITFSVAMVFVFTAVMFIIYDRLVERRQRLVVATAQQSSAIVDSLFPGTIRERLMKQSVEGINYLSPNNRIKSFLNNGQEIEEGGMSEDGDVIADLFPFTTVCFADVCCVPNAFGLVTQKNARHVLP